MSAYYRFSRKFSCLFCCLVLSLPANFAGAAEVYKSPEADFALIELFTSEGCSSCPPAERWLNGLSGHRELWQRLFPIAWHVDYWDDLGWPDPFASSEHSQRQRRYKRQTALNSVYTPGVLVNGQAWRAWVRGQPIPFGRGGAANPGVLIVEVAEGAVRARLESASSAQAPSTRYRMQVALLGFDLVSQVARGENRGRRLEHHFVVLARQDMGLDGARWQAKLPKLAAAYENKRLALVGWLEAPDSPIPLQVAGGWYTAE